MPHSYGLQQVSLQKFIAIQCVSVNRVEPLPLTQCVYGLFLPTGILTVELCDSHDTTRLSLVDIYITLDTVLPVY